MRDLLDFDDAGAGDDEPAKGVTIGDIRSWHDEYAKLENESQRDYQSLEADCGRLRSALRKIADWCPATQEITLAHTMAEEAQAALDVR